MQTAKRRLNVASDSLVPTWAPARFAEQHLQTDAPAGCSAWTGLGARLPEIPTKTNPHNQTEPRHHPVLSVHVFYASHVVFTHDPISRPTSQRAAAHLQKVKSSHNVKPQGGPESRSPGSDQCRETVGRGGKSFTVCGTVLRARVGFLHNDLKNQDKCNTA